LRSALELKAPTLVLNIADWTTPFNKSLSLPTRMCRVQALVLLSASWSEGVRQQAIFAQSQSQSNRIALAALCPSRYKKVTFRKERCENWCVGLRPPSPCQRKLMSLSSQICSLTGAKRMRD
jgi:hypothetical protein